jgi:hypothetical protein
MASCRGLRTQMSGSRNRNDSDNVHAMVGPRRKNLGVPVKEANISESEGV